MLSLYLTAHDWDLAVAEAGDAGTLFVNNILDTSRPDAFPKMLAAAKSLTNSLHKTNLFNRLPE